VATPPPSRKISAQRSKQHLVTYDITYDKKRPLPLDDPQAAAVSFLQPSLILHLVTMEYQLDAEQGRARADTVVLRLC
jgi:hypothetical protein